MATDFEHLRKYPRHDALDYALMLRKLLPKGRLWGFLLPAESDVVFDTANDFPIWNDDPASGNVINDANSSSGTDSSSVFGKFMIVIGEELERLEIRAFDLVAESVAGLSVEMVAEYKEQYIRDEDELALITCDEDVQRLAHGKEYNEALPYTKANCEAHGLTLGFVINVIESPTYAVPLICSTTSGVNSGGTCGVLEADGSETCGGSGAFSIVEIEILSGNANLELMKSLIERSAPAHIVIIWTDLR